MAATRKSIASLSDIRKELVAVYHGVEDDKIDLRKARTLSVVASRIIYATNSIVRASRNTGKALVNGNLDWAA